MSESDEIEKTYIIVGSDRHDALDKFFSFTDQLSKLHASQNRHSVAYDGVLFRCRTETTYEIHVTIVVNTRFETIVDRIINETTV